MIKNFRTYQLAVTFYRATQNVQLPCHLKDQFQRAASSIALNLGEGYGKLTWKDKRKFYSIALGSVRECEAIMDLAPFNDEHKTQLDRLAGSAYCLVRAMGTLEGGG
jgi:four helix bundle protein